MRGTPFVRLRVVDVTISAGNTTGTASVGGGDIIGFYPGTLNQMIKSIEINNGVVTVTLVAAATADNIIHVVTI